jgi:simple sugar transport system permease protein
MTQTATPPSTAAPERKNPLANLDWRRYVIYIGFAVVFLFFAITLGDDGFLTGNNLLNIVRQTATVTIIAVGMTYVIAAAQIDLSVGATAGLASVVTAMTIANYGVFLGILAGLAVGVVVGSVNGALVAMLKIPSFLVTLGMLLVVRGSALWLTSGFPQRTWDAGQHWLAVALVGDFYIGRLRVYMSLIWFILLAIAFHYLLTRTRFGNWLQATGGNPGAAKNRGVPIQRVKVILFMLSAAMAAFAGVISSIRVSAANPNSGTGYELEVIAMVVIGGTVLTGGRGSILGTVLGVLILRLMRNGIVLIGVPGLAYNIFIGAIILGMMALHSGLERRHHAGS